MTRDSLKAGKGDDHLGMAVFIISRSECDLTDRGNHSRNNVADLRLSYISADQHLDFWFTVSVLNCPYNRREDGPQALDPFQDHSNQSHLTACGIQTESLPVVVRFLQSSNWQMLASMEMPNFLRLV